MNAPAGAVNPISVLASAPRSAAANSVAVLTADPFLLLFTCAHARHSAPASFSAFTASTSKVPGLTPRKNFRHTLNNT